jgi:polyhydroxyalkanoate synthesis repressor PhaR
MENPVILKKYANRRLYDTEQSAYVTLSQVAQLIKEGREVAILDAKTEEDVTAFILTQIILEEAKQNHTLLPVALLHLIIRHGDNLLGEFFEKYLQQVFENFIAHKKAVDGQCQHWLELGQQMTATAQKGLGEISPFAPFFDPFGSSKKKED